MRGVTNLSEPKAIGANAFLLPSPKTTIWPERIESPNMHERLAGTSLLLIHPEKPKVQKDDAYGGFALHSEKSRTGHGVVSSI